MGDNIFRGRRPVYFGNPDLPLTPTPWRPRAVRRGLVRMATGSDRLWRVFQRMTWPLRLQSATVRLGAGRIYQFEQPFVVDSSKFDTDFGTTATPYEDGVRATLAWYREDPRRLKRSLVAG